MTLLAKKVAGVGLTLVGGLIIAHGALEYRTAEILFGLLVLGIGVVLLAAKVVRRNASAEKQVNR